MKKTTISVVLGLMIVIAMPSCFHINDDNVSISVSDDENEYEMEADYQRRKTRAVQVYLNDHLLNGEVKLKRNDHVNREITLDDNTTFYINTEPGSINIKIDKTKNSEAQCEKIRIACEDLKEILAQH